MRIYRQLVVAALLAGTAPLSTPSMAATAVSTEGREAVDLAHGWRFRFGGDATGITAPGFDDNKWQSVDLPHTWNRLGEYATVRSPETNNSQGIGWYRLGFTAPAAAPGRRQYLQFDGVGNIAEVWVNGTRAGEHKGAFSRFRFDVTSLLKPGAPNLIVVKADNSKPAPGSSTENVIPLGGDFFIFGGLYRKVALISAGPASIDLLDHGGPGVYAKATSVTPDRAEVEVVTRLRNAGRAQKLSVVTTIADASGATVATTTMPVTLAATGDARQSLNVPKPHLWNGRADPYMYTVGVELRDGAAVIDKVVQPLGIRTFHVDVNDGFSLNGKYLQLVGAARHQDRPVKGWALSPADHAEDMAIMADMGANTVRMAHYQHAQEWDDAADKTGMVAWAEIPFVNGVSFGDGEAASAALTANAREQLTELIRQNYNHPSIMMWSVGNEVDIGANFGRSSKAPQSLGLLKDLAALAKAEDPSRPTTFADCCEESGDRSPPGQQMLAGATDLMGYNRYYGWYYGKPAEFGPKLDHFHAKHPTVPMSVSEYGAGGALSQHSDNPLGGPVSTFGRPHPEEFESWYHEESWKALKDRKYLFADWVWNLFDFSSDLRQEGDAIDLNDKGLVTYDRKIKKDAFYFYRANWSSEPTLHITSSRYVDRAYPVTNVRVYSNADKVALTVNGVAIGSQPCPDRICVWPNVALKPGANAVMVSAEIGGAMRTDSVTWNGPDLAKGFHLDAGDLAARLGPDGVRHGSDTFFTGGTAKQLNVRAGFGDTRKQVKKVVTGAGDLTAYDYYREGSFGYDLPIPNGRWTVTVATFEPNEALAGSRSFTVTTSGGKGVTGYNPSKAAGGVLKAAALSIPVTVRDGHLTLDFAGVGGPAVVAAIDVMPR
ncbi:DUF4982 domain-containing protein [Polymorphobacter sp. PAMC 29334]|uniref:glycoside hydrolase family 2 TIM barrel-domain containing protein n=1 Tax=Polymorphobacter sp. PAMC 29334 TaxID=2862331 RepID=UPI001C795774|nr:glycoside hydrolase family 2 TIM barrel-domain containing protein [Polymorphobacter sp. PAMC 29334]QYE33878.1 DUF4982 domain-containing protein [Polymorphobacter sp. PAMC 29334]